MGGEIRALRELEYERKTGELIGRDVAEQFQFATARGVRATLFRIPRVRPVCVVARSILDPQLADAGSTTVLRGPLE